MVTHTKRQKKSTSMPTGLRVNKKGNIMIQEEIWARLLNKNRYKARCPNMDPWDVKKILSDLSASDNPRIYIVT